MKNSIEILLFCVLFINHRLNSKEPEVHFVILSFSYIFCKVVKLNYIRESLCNQKPLSTEKICLNKKPCLTYVHMFDVRLCLTYVYMFDIRLYV